MGDRSTYETLCQVLGKKLGAWRSFVVAMVAEDVPIEGERVWVLGGMPVRCADVRLLGRGAREEGRALVVDNGGAGFAGCPAVRLGAHVSIEPMGEGTALVGVSRDVGQVLTAAVAAFEKLPVPSEDVCEGLLASVPKREALWHVTSDAAQAVAAYLSCHPRVVELRYPGLKTDPSFEVAARTLTGGFGSWVDYRVYGADSCQRYTATTDNPRAQVLCLEDVLARAGER